MNSFFLKIFISLALLVNPLVSQYYCVVHEHFLRDCSSHAHAFSLANLIGQFGPEIPLDGVEKSSDCCGDCSSDFHIEDDKTCCPEFPPSRDSEVRNEAVEFRLAAAVAESQNEQSFLGTEFCPLCFQQSEFCESRIFDVCFLTENLFQFLLFLAGALGICCAIFQIILSLQWNLRRCFLAKYFQFSQKRIIRGGIRLHLLKKVLIV